MYRFKTVEERNKYLTSLVKQYRPKIYAYFSIKLDDYHKQEAEDFTQEVFTQVIRIVKISDMPLRHAQAYLYAVAKNLCTKIGGEVVALSLEQHTKPNTERETAPLQFVSKSTGTMLGLEQLSEAFSAIESLSGVTRDIMRLVAKNFTVSEIAEKLGIPESTVKWHRSRGRETITQQLQVRFPREVDGSEQT